MFTAVPPGRRTSFRSIFAAKDLTRYFQLCFKVLTLNQKTANGRVTQTLGFGSKGFSLPKRRKKGSPCVRCTTPHRQENKGTTLFYILPSPFPCSPRPFADQNLVAIADLLLPFLLSVRCLGLKGIAPITGIRAHPPASRIAPSSSKTASMLSLHYTRGWLH